MNMLATLATNDDIAQETDSVGGSRVLDSALYLTTVDVAYLEKSKGGALGLVLHLSTDTDQELRNTLWAASGDAKGNKNYYLDKQGNKKYLPGFLHANALALLTVGKEISQLETEERVIKLYSKEAGGEVPTKVNMLVDLVGQQIITGLLKQVVDKTVVNDNGVYVPTGETREENEIDKFFRASDRMTTAEIRAQATEATFAETWEKKWTGVTKDRASKGNGSAAGAPKAANSGAAAKPTTSLFG